ncbi:MAG: thioredoxin-dependent thiol peroxidase [Flavobacteriaceae bacterium]|jgi:peroxiredoxin Q/BCP|nr:thioredoxin-dependent thiol peroxidase [Flavobacteriaceae bacterium]
MNTLKVGDKAPEFQVLNQNENPVKSSELKGRAYILFFYPRASTPGCTAEACSLNDKFSELRKSGFEIFGVSEDTPAKQMKFKEKYGFTYDLLADTEHQLIDAYGVWGPKKFMGKEYDGLHRTTFIINADGIISYVINKVRTKDHADQILELLG